MELATGAMGSLLPKLTNLLKEEYQLQTGVQKDVEYLERELKSMEVALSKVTEVPRDQLDKQVRLWADEVRKLSYEMEDVVDSFLVRVEGSDRAVDPDTFKGFMEKMPKLFNKIKARHQIADTIKDIRDRVQEVAARRDRYKVDDVLHLIRTVHANPAATNTVDPRMLALFKDQRELVGIEKPRDELIKRLTDRDDGVSKQQLKILSIFGFGGLGKTTLAKAVYDKLQVKFDCKSFISVGQNPSLKKVLMDILCQVLDEKSYLKAKKLDLDEEQLIGKLRGLLEKKRYLIVVDDIWDVKSWEIIRCAWVDSSCGSIIITTTRIIEVAEEAGHVYNHEPLSCDNSRELFCKRLSIGKGKYSFDHTVEISEKILQKCGGVPLAIVTIASLLADKPSEDWSEVYNSIGFGHGDNVHVDNTRKIMLFSYYDLPYYLRTCLLHLSIYPEDQEIQKETLIWKWVGEGFVRDMELGEIYFNELINRSMIQPVEKPHQGIVYGCRVHDLVLDMIYSLSKEDNFFIVLGSNKQHTCPQSNARRIAVQGRFKHQHNPMANTPMPQVRSFNVMMCHLSMQGPVSMMPSLLSFQALRVLAVEGSNYMMDCPYNFGHLRKLLQLRYLGLVNTPITELPKEIGDLRFLQILDLRQTLIKKLPRSVGQLSQLKCLSLKRSIGGIISVSDWLGNLTSLEEVSLEYVSVDCMKELGKLTELRVFKIRLGDCDPELLKDMMDSLGNMQRLQALHIDCWVRDIDGTVCDGWADCGWVFPRHLRHVSLLCFLPRLPARIDSSHLPLLSHLELWVKVVKSKDVEILGKFPELLSLQVSISTRFFPNVIGGGAFPKLRYFSADAKLRFLHGAMPSLESVHYGVWHVEVDSLERDFTSLGNLPCLQKVKVSISRSLPDLEELEAALRHAVKVRPNNPTLECSLVHSDFEMEKDNLLPF